MLVTTSRPVSVNILMGLGQIWYHKWDPAYAKIKDDPSNIGNHYETQVLRSINYYSYMPPSLASRVQLKLGQFFVYWLLRL